MSQAMTGIKTTKKEEDNTSIQIEIPSTEISSQSHDEQTPVEYTPVTSPHAENTTNLKLEPALYRAHLYGYALGDLWLPEVIDKFDMVSAPLTGRGDTALHVAVGADSNTFVEELVNIMTPENLGIRNADGNTAFCIAAITGNGKFCKIMLEKNEDLSQIRGQKEMLPIHLAALAGNHNIVQYLSSVNSIDNMRLPDIEQLFFLTMGSSMYDVARKLFKSYPALAIARDDQGLTGTQAFEGVWFL